MDGRGHGQSMESTKTMWMKAEQGSEICTRNAWEKESLWSISFVKGLHRVSFFRCHDDGRHVGNKADMCGDR